MHPKVKVKRETARGCGFRKPGKHYLIGYAPRAHCGRLPARLLPCDHCGRGYDKPFRAFMWATSHVWKDVEECDQLDLPADVAKKEGQSYCLASGCPVQSHITGRIERIGMIWVSDRFYPSVHDFTSEAQSRGISRAIPAVPLDFVVGESWVALAHKHCCFNLPLEIGKESELGPGIFMVFKPERIERVVTREEASDHDFVEDLVSRGLTPVVVETMAQVAMEVAR